MSNGPAAAVSPEGRSQSIERPGYWWYRARADLLGAALAPLAGPSEHALDVGSADGPSVAWLHRDRAMVAVDIDPRGLVPGRSVCASLTELPFADATFDLVGAFDVIEHVEDEARAVSEIVRVLRPGGRLLASVPAYQWAWSDHDVRAGHHRRYTRPRFTSALESGGLVVVRATYGFGGVFPFFVAERLARRLRGRRGAPPSGSLPEVSPTLDRVLMGLSRAEARWLARRDVPFGSSVFVAAHRASGPDARAVAP